MPAVVVWPDRRRIVCRPFGAYQLGWWVVRGSIRTATVCHHFVVEPQWFGLSIIDSNPFESGWRQTLYGMAGHSAHAAIENTHKMPSHTIPSACQNNVATVIPK